MLAFSPLVHWFLRQRFRQIEAWMEYPNDTQNRVFQFLLKQGRDTEWGRKFDFASIRNPDAFRARVPLQDYNSLKPFIRRMMQGEQNILWNSTIKWFSKSSGTTSDKSKFIPMSRESIEDCHFRGGMDLLSAYCHAHPDTGLLGGKGIIVGGSYQTTPGQSSILTGDLSAVLMHHMSFFAQFFRTPDLSIALMNDWEQKLEALAQATVNEHVTSISGVPTWTLLLLRRVMELKKTDDIKKVWPGLELYIHGGVSFTPYAPEFSAIIPAPMNYCQTYNASEGFFAFQLEPDDADMVLHLDSGIYYEFIPAGEFGKEHPKTILLHETTTGQNYGLVISTNGGLWRYVVGDTIRFTSTSPYRIQVSGRMKHFINVFGEEVIVENADQALREACEVTGAVVSDYTVAPVYLTRQHRGGHEWLVEFSTEPESLTHFSQVLDEALRNINSDYDAKRMHDLALDLPVVRSLPAKTFYNWLKSKNRLGGQHKVPRLSNDRNLADEILLRLESHGS